MHQSSGGHLVPIHLQLLLPKRITITYADQFGTDHDQGAKQNTGLTVICPKRKKAHNHREGFLGP
jgi:hypothetical protein